MSIVSAPAQAGPGLNDERDDDDDTSAQSGSLGTSMYYIIPSLNCVGKTPPIFC